MHNSLFCCIKKFKNKFNFVYVLVHRNILMYVILACHFIYVDVILKTILAVTLFSIILLRVCQRLVCRKMKFAAR